MSKIIYKYNLDLEALQIVTMPIGAEILTVQVQHGMPFLWAIIDDDEKKTREVPVIIIGTGHKMPDVGKYLGTFQLAQGNFVGHVFLKPNLCKFPTVI